MLTVAGSVTRILVSESRSFWLRNRLVFVAEAPFFWLRKRLFLVSEARKVLVAESRKFGCGIAGIWFRNRNLFVKDHYPY